MTKVFWKVGFFVIIYINDHGTAWQDLFLTFIKVAHVVNIKLGFTDYLFWN